MLTTSMTDYTDFEGGVNLVSKLPTTHRGQTLAPGTGFAVDIHIQLTKLKLGDLD